MIPIDLLAGQRQRYVEDCPVCCHPIVISIELDESGEVRVWSEHE